MTSDDHPHADKGCQRKIDDAERHRAGKTSPKPELYKRFGDARMDERKDVASGGAGAGGI
jgi:hypothetical protein